MLLCLSFNLLLSLLLLLQAPLFSTLELCFSLSGPIFHLFSQLRGHLVPALLLRLFVPSLPFFGLLLQALVLLSELLLPLTHLCL